MRAVKAGYNFNLFPEESLSHINLKPTGGKVEVKGVVYPLYRGTTYAENFANKFHNAVEIEIGYRETGVSGIFKKCYL